MRRSNPFFAFWIALLALFLSGCGDTKGYKTPSLSNPERMSGDTLCYRASRAKADPAIDAEIRARRLDCNDLAAEPSRPVSDLYDGRGL